MENETSEFAAKEPSLGYFYQIRYGLYILLSNRELSNPVLRIENLDDIEIVSQEGSRIFQTKLKMKSKANLTDSSVDFWKTIRVWSDNIKKNRLDVDSTIFFLITTETVGANSYLMALKSRGKTSEEISNVILKMDSVATSSSNDINKKAYAEYLSLSVDQKTNLIRNIIVVDAALDVGVITKSIKAELAFSSPPKKIDPFLEVLEGWWFKKSIEYLLDQIDGISFEEVQFKISDIRDSFSQDNLPNDFDAQLEISDQEAKEERDKVYLKQLDIISVSVSSNTAKRAISDFRRAFEQRSKWLREELLSPDEQGKYDNRLYDYWKNLFDILQDECDGQTLEQLREIGKKFYLNQFAKSCPPLRIRERFTADYLTRGSFQILSDHKRIGWHPNYKDLIE